MHVFHLRGDIRENPSCLKRPAREGGESFRVRLPSMTGIAISVFVKNLDAKEQGRIQFHDIGDYLRPQAEARDTVRSVSAAFGASTKRVDGPAITPDEHGDWLDQRDAEFRPRIR